MPKPTRAAGALLDQTIDRFWETMPPMWHQIREHLRELVTARCDISVEQFHLLRNIRRGTGSVSQLAAAKHISRAATSQAVAALVRKGLIVRRPSLEDRRCVQLELTGAGSQLLDAIFETNRGWMKARMAGLGPEELLSLQRGLEALNAAFVDPAAGLDH